ncbi:CPBP family intramembrane glutamic endopeptidase [Flectobacillus major]|jgi:membrane protease YdiL (CAAX protease family)|uniref:CPBP family intramembrane glutamic endopeptidase n=1 Tax=Flectobacillus major TaxID=103 RepID=UPI0004128172|nr:type II CAAX endopeptidase family protein [Flectobacillus major]
METKNAFIEQANLGENKLWQYIVGFVVVLLGLILFSYPQVLVTDLHTQKPTVASHWYLMIAILSFIGGILALWFWLSQMHRRPLVSLITPNSSVNWTRVLYSGLLWFGCTVVIEMVFYGFDPSMYRFSLNLEQWIPTFVVGIIFIPIQSSCEELIFRGYLLQGIGSRNIVVGVLVSSILFGLMHSFNPETQKVGFALAMSYYISVGLFFALLTYFDQKMELALGIHASNNIYSFLFVSYPDSALPSPSVFSLTSLNFSLMILGWGIAVVLYVLIARKVFHLKFGTN